MHLVQGFPKGQQPFWRVDVVATNGKPFEVFGCLTTGTAANTRFPAKLIIKLFGELIGNAGALGNPVIPRTFKAP